MSAAATELRVPADAIQLDLCGEAVAVPPELARTLAAAAAARAGVSSRHRDLSLLLGRALEEGRVTLGRAEVRTLRAVLEEENAGGGLGSAGQDLLRASASV